METQGEGIIEKGMEYYIGADSEGGRQGDRYGYREGRRKVGNETWMREGRKGRRKGRRKRGMEGSMEIQRKGSKRQRWGMFS